MVDQTGFRSVQLSSTIEMAHDLSAEGVSLGKRNADHIESGNWLVTGFGFADYWIELTEWCSLPDDQHGLVGSAEPIEDDSDDDFGPMPMPAAEAAKVKKRKSKLPKAVVGRPTSQSG